MRRTRYLWVAVLLLSAAVIVVAETLERSAQRAVTELLPDVTWQARDPYPELPPTGLWAADQPEVLSAEAFGRLFAERTIYLTAPQVEAYRLETALPKAPRRLPVYLVGRYPDGHAVRLDEVVQGQDGWEFEPKLSLIDFGIRGEHRLPPAAGQGRITTADTAIAHARAFLGPLLMPDTADATAVETPEGWQVVFVQRIGGMPIYGDKPFQARLSADGHLIYALGRRRPILYRSDYPIRDAKAAWQDLTSGKGYGFTLIHGAPAPGAVAEFVVTKVELCYLVPHVNTDIEVMQPHWAFRDATGATLFVPAVAEPYMTWPRLGG